MSLSVALPSGRSTEIRDVSILDSETCRRRVARMTRQAHGRGLHWEPVGNVVDQVVHLIEQTDRLAEIAIASTQSLLELVGWTGEIVRSSDLVARTERSLRLADLTLAVGAAAYICGTGGSRYLEGDVFADVGLGVQYFSCPESGVWAGASRVSAIAALAEDGRAFLSEAGPQLSTKGGR
jgi:hypothetical protein